MRILLTFLRLFEKSSSIKVRVRRALRIEQVGLLPVRQCQLRRRPSRCQSPQRISISVSSGITQDQGNGSYLNGSWFHLEPQFISLRYTTETWVAANGSASRALALLSSARKHCGLWPTFWLVYFFLLTPNCWQRDLTEPQTTPKKETLHPSLTWVNSFSPVNHPCDSP